MSAQHHETYKATPSWHSVWTMIAHMAMEFRLRFLALVWHGSLQCGSVREYMEGTVRFENNVRCTMDMPAIMPPKPTRNGPGTKNHCQPCKKKEPGTPRNVLYSFPIVKSDVPGFRVVGTRINIKKKKENQERWRCGKMTIFVEMVQTCRLQQGFRRKRARASYSWSPVPGRAGFSSAHWILWAKPKLQTRPTWGLFLGSQKQAFLASWLWALIVYTHNMHMYIILYIQTRQFFVTFLGWLNALFKGLSDLQLRD